MNDDVRARLERAAQAHQAGREAEATAKRAAESARKDFERAAIEQLQTVALPAMREVEALLAEKHVALDIDKTALGKGILRCVLVGSGCSPREPAFYMLTIEPVGTKNYSIHWRRATRGSSHTGGDKVSLEDMTADWLQGELAAWLEACRV